MKQCRHCDQDKPTADFPTNRRTRDGLSSWCKECHKAATRKWRAEHGAEYNARRRAREVEDRKEWIAAAGEANRERWRGASPRGAR